MEVARGRLRGHMGRKGCLKVGGNAKSDWDVDGPGSLGIVGY
jgi:hypothetical protein